MCVAANHMFQAAWTPVSSVSAGPAVENEPALSTTCSRRHGLLSRLSVRALL